MPASASESDHPNKHTVSTFKVRVGVVLFKKEATSGKLSILMMRQNNYPFWVFPGGTLEPGEGLAACAVRELEEETGLVIQLQQLLGVADFLNPKRQTVDVFFLAEHLSGVIPAEPPYPENIDEIQWFTQADFEALPVQPALIKQQVLTTWQQNLKTEKNLYLGTYTP